jgi:hypothetical protein
VAQAERRAVSVDDKTVKDIRAVDGRNDRAPRPADCRQSRNIDRRTGFEIVIGFR